MQTEEPTATEPQPETQEAIVPTTKKKGGKSAKAPDPEPKKKGGRTLADAARGYIDAIAGTSNTSTLASYEGDLKVALAHLGAETELADLTAKKVQNYFDSDRVTLKRSGKAKSPISIAKTRRTLRLCLEWAASNGWMAMAEIPGAKEPKAASKAKKEPKAKKAGTKKAAGKKGRTVVHIVSDDPTPAS